MGRRPGPHRRDVYTPVCEASGMAVTNRQLAIITGQHESIPSMKVRDFLIESNTAVYLCETFFTKDVTGQPALGAMVVTKAAETNAPPTMTGQPIWGPLFGAESELKGARMMGSYEKGTLSIEVDAVEDGYITTHTNRFVSGRWVVSDGPSKRFERRTK
jgi:hypothetical protein